MELLADEEPGTTLDEVEAEAQRAPLTAAPPRERKPHPGRQRLPENLPRVEEVVPCAEQTCRQCGAETAVIGYDESEQLDVEPARYFVRVIKREKRACRCCEKGAVTMAPLAPRIVEKGLASDRVVVETVVAKYCGSSAAVPAGGDPGAGSGTGDRPGDAGRLGDAGGRVAGAGGGGDAAGSAAELVSASRRDDRAGADARQTRSGSPGVLVAIRQAGRRDGIRFPLGPRARGSAEVPGAVGRDLTNRRLSGLRRHRRAEAGACGLLGACPA